MQKAQIIPKNRKRHHRTHSTMFLKKREFWGGRARGPAPPELPPPPDEASAAATEASSELASSLENRRLYREVTLALRTALRDATAEFSFLRLRGLRNLLKSLRSIADSDDAIRLFRQSQSLHELQGIDLDLDPFPRVLISLSVSFYSSLLFIFVKNKRFWDQKVCN